MALIKENLALVLAQIKSTALSCGRDPKHIKLIAVSKGQPLSSISEAYDAGQRDFGESYAQEMAFKIKESQNKNMPDIIWHYIGGIQSNKIKLISKAQVVHSIASIRQAELLNENTLHPIDVFLQLNLCKEPGRQGFAQEDIENALKALAPLENLRFKGLMTIAPLSQALDPRPCFTVMRNLREDLQKDLKRPLALSMGMSNDFTIAIHYGADFVRVGSSIFGPRG